MTDTSTSPNQELKKQFLDLVDKVKANQAILDKFQTFELAMLSAESITDLIEVLLFKSMRFFDLCDCTLIWFDRQQELRPMLTEDSWQKFQHRLLLGLDVEAVISFFAANCKPQLRPLTDSEKDKWFPHSTQVKSAAFIPLICDGVLVGSFNFASAERSRFTADKAVDFMAHMGLIAAMCLQNSANKEQIRRMSMIDTLTKVDNRRCFDNDIAKEVARAQRTEQPLSCLFVDIDFFKKVNDTYGHQAGDLALSSVAAWVKLQLRECDHLARYGGEEFAILLPDCNEELACQVAERIRLHVEEQAVQFGETEINLTLSIGVCTFTATEHVNISREAAMKTLISCADLAVYDAKDCGRNTICVREFDPEQLPAMFDSLVDL